jgi:lipopolysaccharide/colanic/teichoic acid biosynthesis glycosyltransferase/glycosyltransferase involved in cell wall biosynthesis
MIIELLLLSLGLVIVYHHVIYPMIIARVAKRYSVNTVDMSKFNEKTCPRIGILMCAYNEEASIRDKLFNLAMLQYPNSRFNIHLLLDGCTDKTEHVAKQTIKTLQRQNVRIELHINRVNIGKCRSLNRLINETKDQYDVLLFSDVSTLLSIDGLKRIAVHFLDESIKVVSGRYLMLEATEQQKQYWAYQNTIKQNESKLGSMIGAPGAMLAIRSHLVAPLEQDTINDDFVLAMRAIANGGKALLDPEISLVELEGDTSAIDYKRRKRIAAGNFQQIFRLLSCLKPSLGWTAFNFFSHKVLRGIMPVIIASFYVCSLVGAYLGNNIAFLLVITLLTIHLTGLFPKWFSVNAKINYVITSYIYCLSGIGGYMSGHYSSHWRRVNESEANSSKAFDLVKFVKRLMDVVGSLFLLIVLSPVMLISAVIIKLTSKGPVIFKQLRVGEYNEEFVSLFYVFKFRSMVCNAEKLTGAVWATKNDPRITAFGRIMRKTRIDELPQLINVLLGQMSLIGPRPERPDFYLKLEREVPYFTQRTYGLKPGISGLAQVMNGYDEDIEGIRRKIAWDYAYALSMSNFKAWMSMEWSVMLKTIMVVVTGKGQ